MKYVLTSFIVLISTVCYAGPFGLESGMTVDELRQATNVQLTVDMKYLATMVPRPAGFDKFIFSMGCSGLWGITAIKDYSKFYSQKRNVAKAFLLLDKEILLRSLYEKYESYKWMWYNDDLIIFPPSSCSDSCGCYPIIDGVEQIKFHSDNNKLLLFYFFDNVAFTTFCNSMMSDNL